MIYDVMRCFAIFPAAVSHVKNFCSSAEQQSLLSLKLELFLAVIQHVARTFKGTNNPRL